MALHPWSPDQVGCLSRFLALACRGVDLGASGVSHVELLILYELWAGERLTLEKVHPRYLRPGRPISVSTVPFGPGIDIRRSCRSIGTLMRSLCMLPGGLGCRPNGWLLVSGWEVASIGAHSQ